MQKDRYVLFHKSLRIPDKTVTSKHNHVTSQIQNCGVFLHGHHVDGGAVVVPAVLCPEPLNNKQGCVDVCLAAVEHPAEVCWRD